MAKTSTERARESRQRLKEKGGSTFFMTLSPEQVAAAQSIGKLHGLNLSANETLRDLVNAQINRLTAVMEERIRLQAEFNAPHETIEAYVMNEVNRWNPLTAEQFLAGER